jgi:hypothetical protein
MLATLAISGLVCACGYGSDTGYVPSGDNPAGFYSGTLVSAASGSAEDVVALASDAGELDLFDPKTHMHYVAGLSFADDGLKRPLIAYAAPGTAFPDASSVCQGSVSGKLKPGVTLTGSYSCGGDHGTFSLLYDVYASLQAPSERFPLVGARGDIGAGDLMFLSTDRDGNLTGSDTAGCSYEGQMTVIDPFINVFGVTLDQTCGSQTLALAGLASFGFIQDSSTQALYLAVSDGMHSISGALQFE